LTTFVRIRFGSFIGETLAPSFRSRCEVAIAGGSNPSRLADSLSNQFGWGFRHAQGSSKRRPMPTIHGWLTSTLLPPMSSRARRPMMLHERGILHSTRVRRRLLTSRCFVMRSGTTAVASDKADRLNPCIGCRHVRRIFMQLCNRAT